MAVNGLYIVQGESNAVVALLKKAHRGWPHHQQQLLAPPLDETDPLLRNFADLRDVLNSVNELSDMSPDTFLSPFLDVIRSEQTNGPVTAQALSSVAKFLSYGLIDSTSIKASNAVENIAAAVTHAKFVGSTDSGSDEVVLLKILQVLRTLLLTPVGRLLSNESVCEVMQSCFRICFEGALSELLRKAAESTLADMTQLIFTRLPSFKEDIRHPYIRKLVKRAGGLNGKRKRRKATSLREVVEPEIIDKNFEHVPKEEITEKTPLVGATEAPVEEESIDAVVVSDVFTKDEENRKTEDVGSHAPALMEGERIESSTEPADRLAEFDIVASDSCENVATVQASGSQETVSAAPNLSSKNATTEDLDDGVLPDNDDSTVSGDDDYNTGSVGPTSRQRINDRGVRFTPESEREDRAALRRERKTSSEPVIVKPTSHIPYGLPCARELLRFLIALTNPLDRANTESMILMGLNLLTVALEAGADYFQNYTFLMPLVKNELCRALLQLLDTEKLPVFAATSRVCFLLFESLRTGLKFQLESYFNKLKSIVTSEQTRISYEQKEMALESIVQLWRIPGLVTELYLNYDCDVYCSNLFEDLTKLLLENAFPVMGLRSTHILSLDALLTVIDTIDINCVYRQAGSIQRQCSPNSSAQLSLPAISGYSVGLQIEASQAQKNTLDIPGKEDSEGEKVDVETSALLEALLPSSAVRANRMPPSRNLPSLAEVIERKKKKRILTEGTELFNQDPKKGIEFLKEKGILKSPLDPADVVVWLRENPRLDKKRIADYICNRKNLNVLDAFVRSFPFENTRLDDALRMFLETFRLPGEAAEISMVMQHFADHWYKANNEPFNHVDAAFTLSYAVIMLNTDQHNPQVRRNQAPMQVECFKRNLSGTNGGQDFDQDMLEQMFHAIKSEEIVMPAEQTGLVKENYLWKVLLRRGEKKEGEFIHVPAGWNDHDLFGIIWGPAIAALSFVFDKSEQECVLQKSLNGYRKCASIAAHYGMSDVFDNLIIHLCKFSTLMTSAEGSAEQNMELQRSGGLSEMTAQNAEQVAIAFGENIKAQMAAKAMFQLVHTHGDILREGWKNILDCILHLFRSRLLPSSLTEVEDFVDPKGWVSIQRTHTPKVAPHRNDSGLLSWLGLGGSSYDTREVKLTADQQQFIKAAHNVIAECHPEQLVTDGKYLTSSALTELINALVQASSNVVAAAGAIKPGQSKKISEQDEDALLLYLELAISITLENKDRLAQIWPSIKHHLQWLMSRFGRNPLVVERAVVGLLRLANRNLFRLKDDMADEVLQSLGMLLKLRPPAMFMFSRQIAFGLHELLRTNAANVHRKEHWAVLFALLEASGAGAYPEESNIQNETSEPSNRSRPLDLDRNAHSDTEPLVSRAAAGAPNGSSLSVSTDRGYTSDDPQQHKGFASPSTTLSEYGDSSLSLAKGASTEWIYLDHRDAAIALEQQQMQLSHDGSSYPPSRVFDRGTVVLRTNLARHDPVAFLKVGETLAFLVRDAAHVTPDNFDSCVQCLSSYVEASLDGGRYAAGPLSGDAQNQFHSIIEDKQKIPAKSKSLGGKRMSLNSSAVGEEDTESVAESEPQQLSTSYHQIAFQMLDLCHTLHVKAGGIYRSWADGGAEVDASTGALWIHCWRPLLRCMARLCCDCRRQVRTQALNYLVRSFLIPEMQKMGAQEWENCFGEVLFPLLQKLLDNLSPMDPIGMEETRVRAMQLISKILLNHLTPLSSLASFPGLWLRLLDFMDRYLHTERSDLLSEAIPESLKNMILVMDNTGMFHAIPGLYEMTTNRMGSLLPELIAEVMPGPPEPTKETPVAASPPPSSSASSDLPVSSHHADSSADSNPVAAASAPLFQSVMGGRVQIAPPLDVFLDDRKGTVKTEPAEQPRPPVDDTVEPVLAPKAVEVPELEEVVVHSGASSPVQSHYNRGNELFTVNPPPAACNVPYNHASFYNQGTHTQTAPPHLALGHFAPLIHTQIPCAVGPQSAEMHFSQTGTAPVPAAVVGSDYAMQQELSQYFSQTQHFSHVLPAGSPSRTFTLVQSPTSAFSPPNTNQQHTGFATSDAHIPSQLFSQELNPSSSSHGVSDAHSTNFQSERP